MAKQGRKARSIRSRILKPIMAMVLVEMLFVYAFIVAGGVPGQILSNAFALLWGAADARGDTMEYKMGEWSNVTVPLEALDALSERLTENNGASLDALLSAESGRNLYLSRAAQILINALRAGDAGGVFIVLDKENGNGRSCVYLRDTTPGSSTQGDADILQLVGAGGLTLDEHWTSRLRVTGDFYDRPMAAARERASADAKNVGYWSEPFVLGGEKVIAYVTPLLDDAGAPYGVFGVEIGLDRIVSLLDSGDDPYAGQGFYALCHSTDGTNWTPIAASREVDFSLMRLTESERHAGYSEAHWDGAPEDAFAAVRALNPYGADSAFANEKWIVADVAYSSALHSTTRAFLYALGMALVLALVLGTACALLATRYIASPVAWLTGQLASVRPGSHALGRIGVGEIDRLADSIERMSEQTLQSASKMARVIELSGMPLAVFEYDKFADKVFCTACMVELAGFSPDQIHEDLMDRTDFDRAWGAFQASLTLEPEEINVFRRVRPDGSVSYLRVRDAHSGDMTLCVVYDMTEDVINRQALRRERDFDVLTNLLNRRAFAPMATAALRDPTMPRGAMVVWDIDNLKFINDTYGHDMGDKYIRAIADVLRELADDATLVSRVSGDEFSVYLAGTASNEAFLRRVERTMKRLLDRRIVMPDGREQSLSASAGIAFYPDDGEEFDALVRYADFAMYQAKHAQRGSVRRFDKEAYLHDNILLIGSGELNHIIEARLVRFAFQPIVSMADGKLLGYEALMRPQSELITNPTDLLRLAAERSKLRQIETLTWLEATRAFASNLMRNEDALLFINSAANQCIEDDRMRVLEGMYPTLLKRVVIELTETARIDEQQEKRKRDWAEKNGMRFALDDYGEGYASGARLLTLQPTYVKLDLSIVRDIHLETRKRQFAEQTVRFCHENGMLVIAEGVETNEELLCVRALGVDYVQGFLIGLPEFPDKLMP